MSYLECYMIYLTKIYSKQKLKLLGGCCELELVKLVMSAYQSIVIKICIQCLVL